MIIRYNELDSNVNLLLPQRFPDHRIRRYIWQIVDGDRIQFSRGTPFPANMQQEVNMLDGLMNNDENIQYYVAIRIFVEGSRT